MCKTFFQVTTLILATSWSFGLEDVLYSQFRTRRCGGDVELVHFRRGSVCSLQRLPTDHTLEKVPSYIQAQLFVDMIARLMKRRER